VRPYDAVSTTSDGGIIECVTDAASIDSIKKAAKVQTLDQFFSRAYGGEGSAAYCVAQRNFVESMAGYSVICYLLQIKDRHNGNLMLTRAGHIVHIDFGFMLATSPGGIKFENAPFKLSEELIAVMGGAGSATFAYFKVLVYQAFKLARDHADELLALITLMVPYNTIPCFGSDPDQMLGKVKSRFRFDLQSEVEFAVYVRELINISVGNWRTRKYDQFQTLQNGIV
jgi:phosphatidylinositol 4-kinase